MTIPPWLRPHLTIRNAVTAGSILTTIVTAAAAWFWTLNASMAAVAKQGARLDKHDERLTALDTTMARVDERTGLILMILQNQRAQR